MQFETVYVAPGCRCASWVAFSASVGEIAHEGTSTRVPAAHDAGPAPKRACLSGPGSPAQRVGAPVGPSASASSSSSSCSEAPRQNQSQFCDVPRHSLVLPGRELTARVRLVSDGKRDTDALQNAATAWNYEFWENLHYTSKCDIRDGELCVKLACRLWTSSAYENLVRRAGGEACGVSELVIEVSSKPTVAASVSVAALAQYTTELFLSQLEPRFPLVFSTLARERFLHMSASLPALANALHRSPKEQWLFLLNAVKILNSDLSNTTVYQLLTKGTASHAYSLRPFRIA